MVGASGWFDGAEGRSSDEAAFLERLRSLAHQRWEEGHVSPSQTQAHAVLQPLYVEVSIPQLVTPRRLLQVAYWSAERPRLEGSWGDDYLLDDYDCEDRETLTIAGVSATPGQFATWAFEWMQSELSRPLLKEDWLKQGRVVATRWRFGDTGSILASESRSTSLSSEPHRVTQVRGGGK